MKTHIVLGFFFLTAMPLGAASAAEWRVEQVDTPGDVSAIEKTADGVRIAVEGRWFTLAPTEKGVGIEPAGLPKQPVLPAGALPDGHIAIGKTDVARAWLAEPTTRYRHGVLGDAIEAGSLVIELRGGGREVVRLASDAVFEDLTPRLADLDGDGKDEIILVKSYLDRGAALAVVKLRDEKRAIVAETPPIGRPNRWLNPAGIADFDGDGFIDIALVRMPHVLGELELWTWRDGGLHRKSALPDVSNHFIGSRALAMSAVADFDGDGIPDLAISSKNRDRLRIIAFAPKTREIADVRLPAKALTDFAVTGGDAQNRAVVLGLADGSLVAVYCARGTRDSAAGTQCR